MRKLVIVLTGSTVLLGASTLYLAWRLRAVESELAAGASAARESGSGSSESALRATATAAQPAMPVGAQTPAEAPNSTALPGAAASTAAPGSPAPARAVDHQRQALIPYARQFLARLSEPGQRNNLLEEQRITLRRQYAPLKERLGLDTNTFEQVLTILAEQNVEPQEAYFRCVVDPSCDTDAFNRGGGPQLRDRSAELSALLGGRMGELEQFRSSLGDRESVVQLRGRLDESNYLRDDQAEKLVAALAAERKSYQDELTARGATVSGWGTQLGMLMYPGDSNSVEQKLSDAAAYSERLRLRAATVLDAKQLGVFVQIQNELLAAMASYLRPVPESQ